MKNLLPFLLSGLVLGISTGSAQADFSITYTAPANPTTEGFTSSECCGSSTTGPIANDMGLAAWFIAGTAQSSQFGIASGTFTNAQQADIASNGFDLTLVARALPGLAVAYSTNDPIVTTSATVSMQSVNYGISLALNSNGDTAR